MVRHQGGAYHIESKNNKTRRSRCHPRVCSWNGLAFTSQSASFPLREPSRPFTRHASPDPPILRIRHVDVTGRRVSLQQQRRTPFVVFFTFPFKPTLSLSRSISQPPLIRNVDHEATGRQPAPSGRPRRRTTCARSSQGASAHRGRAARLRDGAVARTARRP